MKYFCLFLLLAVLCGCNKDDAPDNSGISGSPNILLIIADDTGKDATQGFSEGSIKPNTPNLNKIKNEGLSFNNLWVNPTCSPTRASIITGKYGYRTGVKWANDRLDQTELFYKNTLVKKPIIPILPQLWVNGIYLVKMEVPIQSFLE